jgi:hypothetical protein
MAVACEINIGSYEGDSGDNHFWKRMQVTKTAHECCECGKNIPGGEEHEHATWYDFDARKTIHAFTCSVCAEIAWAFTDSRLYHNLWDAMYDEFENLTTGCFQKLKTVAAKKELQQRWIYWKGLSQESTHAK